MLKSRGLLPLSLLVLILAGTWLAAGSATRNTGTVPASVQFMDRRDSSGNLTDNIASDGLNGGTYVDGAKGISCYMYTTAANSSTGQHDLILSISVSAKRSLNYRFFPIGGSGPSGIISENTAWINFRDVYSVGTSVPSPQARSAAVSGFLFLGACHLQNNPGEYSTPVLVERLDSKTWRVTADPVAGSEDWVGETREPTPYPADIAQRLSNSAWYSYHMPFQAIIKIK